MIKTPRVSAAGRTTGLLVYHLRVVAALAGLWFASAAPMVAHAQSTFIQRTEHFIFEAPTGSERRLKQLFESADATLEQLGDKWGSTPSVLGGPPIRVVVAANREEFDAAQLAEDGAEPWMAGTAYPARSLIILSLEPHHFFRLEEIAQHEICHVALFRAAGGARMPRWFDEGLAIIEAGEDTAERLKGAAGAALTGRTLPFSGLERGFPASDALARLSYAQSATFVRWLHLRFDLGEKLPGVLASVRAGTSPRLALENALGLPITRLEKIWNEELANSWSWLSLLTDAGAVWSAVGVVAFAALIFAWRRRRRTLAARFGSPDASDQSENWPPTPLPAPSQGSKDDWLQ